jgi:aspartate/methionine/tyrosine aminotransferase
MVAAEALSQESDDYLKQLRHKYKSRGEFLVELFARELDWKIAKPKASMFVWTKLPKQFEALSSFDFCKKMIEETGVVMLPGSSFGKNGEGFVRLSLIHDEANMQKAAAALKTLFEKEGGIAL